jgi:hypothetical protein
VGRAALASGAFRVFPNSDSTFRAVETVRVASLMDLASSSKRLAPDRSSEPLRSAGLLRANTASTDLPLVGIVLSGASPPTTLDRVHSRSRRCRLLLRSTPATGSTCSALVVFHHLSGLLRARGSGVLQPDAGRGSSCFTVAVLRPTEPPERGAGRAKVRGPLPATLFTPFEDTHADRRFASFPAGADPRELRLSSVPRHRGRCRLAVFTTPGLYSDRGAGVARSPLPAA